MSDTEEHFTPVERYLLGVAAARDRQLPELRDLVERLERLAWEYPPAADVSDDILEIIDTLKRWLKRIEKGSYGRLGA